MLKWWKNVDDDKNIIALQLMYLSSFKIKINVKILLKRHRKTRNSDESGTQFLGFWVKKWVWGKLNKAFLMI